MGKKTFNLALGMGPNIRPVRALEKGLFCIRKVAFQEEWPLIRGRNQYIYDFFTLSSGPSRGGGL